MKQPAVLSLLFLTVLLLEFQPGPAMTVRLRRISDDPEKLEKREVENLDLAFGKRELDLGFGKRELDLAFGKRDMPDLAFGKKWNYDNLDLETDLGFGKRELDLGFGKKSNIDLGFGKRMETDLAFGK